MSNLSVDPEGMGREGVDIYDCADYIDDLLLRHRNFRMSLGTPWGEGRDEFAREMDAIMPTAEEAFVAYLEFLATAFRDTADRTVGSARAFHLAEEANTSVGRHLSPDGQGRR